MRTELNVKFNDNHFGALILAPIALLNINATLYRRRRRREKTSTVYDTEDNEGTFP